MAPVTTPPAPGSMTVPPLSGWEVIATLLVVLVAVAVVFVVCGAVRTGSRERREWQAWLEARSGPRVMSAADRDRPGGPAASGAV